MPSTRNRELFKRALSFSKVKLLYTRVTLTKYTRALFFASLISCVVLVALQLVTHADNSTAVKILEGIISKSTVSKVFPIVKDGTLTICNGLPGAVGTKCTGPGQPNTIFSTITPGHVNQHANATQMQWKRNSSPVPTLDSDGRLLGVQIDQGSSGPVLLNMQCVQSLTWLHEVLRDAQREDLVTLCFSVWVFSLSLVAIMNESIPHLGASLAGHLLATGWAGFRVSETRELKITYDHVILFGNGSCKGIDVLGSWWDIRLGHAIPILVMNALTLGVCFYIALHLFRVYASQSFSRVGGSAKVHSVYKAVLLLSVALQLSAFFSLAASAIWVEKIIADPIRSIAEHLRFYLAAFIVTVVLVIPWMTLGWISIRKEHHLMFWIFAGISLFNVAVQTLMFASPLYRYIFSTWPFFATMTVTSYSLTVLCALLAVLCRFQFGNGLAQFLRVLDVLENVNFTPVYFTSDPEKSEQRDSYSESKAIPRWSVVTGDSNPTVTPIHPMPLHAAGARTIRAPVTASRNVPFAPPNLPTPPSATLSSAKERTLDSTSHNEEPHITFSHSRLLRSGTARTARVITPPVPASPPVHSSRTGADSSTSSAGGHTSKF